MELSGDLVWSSLFPEAIDVCDQLQINEIIDVKSIVGVVEIFKKEHHIIYIKNVHQG